FELLTYLAMGIVVVFLILMLTKSVPVGWFVYILGFSILLLIFRLVFRIYFIIQARKNFGGKSSNNRNG
ncbi:MAG: hypothetical protein K8H86_00885, partial [Ignavibacteriaceae bacterium]|nr:hypothetical protein [Ignavibacteriaceae bacterium]